MKFTEETAIKLKSTLSPQLYCLVMRFCNARYNVSVISEIYSELFFLTTETSYQQHVVNILLEHMQALFRDNDMVLNKCVLETIVNEL